MKITFDKTILENAVNDSLCAVSDRSTYPTLECIRFQCKDADSGICTITTFDMIKGFTTDLPCRILKPGNYLINAQKLNRIIKFLPDQSVTIEVDEKNAVSVTSGRSRFSLHALDGETFPNIPELDSDKGFVIDAGVLKTMLGQVSFAIAVTDQRPNLCGAYFEITDHLLKIVACDGNRMALRTTVCKLENRNRDNSAIELAFILPGKTLAQFTRLLGDEGDELLVLATRRHIIFKRGGNIFFSRVVDAAYIDYNRIIPKESKITVVTDRLAFLSSLERAALISEDKSMGQGRSPVKFSFEGDLLKVSCESMAGSVYDEVPIEKEGDDIFIGFNCRHIMDSLRSADSEKIRIGLNSPLMSMVITSADEKTEEEKAKEGSTDFLYLASPVRMK